MSKVKKKHIAKLLPGESVVVMRYDTLMYLAQTCDLLAADQLSEEDAQAWRDLADDIRIQCNENYYDGSAEEEYWT